ncbi:dethiobiotin synthase [Marinicella rhabdoformis]|uniref:dethiobiotin synthase n=1 Tax=Marinicella rhabdoformis TaxID=2580566 RepID=UPI0012AEDD8A|nr:dethiobiotin synthase [Marinicella rhabdoformis]
MKPISSNNFAGLPSCFLTATDTDAGKTHIAGEVLKAWKNAGYSVGAFKPIASGAIKIDDKWVSEDAQRLAEVTGQALSEINPYTFEKPASPHIADLKAEFDLAKCLDLYAQMYQKYDRVLVEGVGGWCVPLSEKLMLKDLALALGLPVVMVARIGLGCINHSLLTINQIQYDSKLLYGWIANCIDNDFEDQKSNIEGIATRIKLHPS